MTFTSEKIKSYADFAEMCFEFTKYLVSKRPVESWHSYKCYFIDREGWTYNKYLGICELRHWFFRTNAAILFMWVDGKLEYCHRNNEYDIELFKNFITEKYEPQYES